MDYWCRCLPPGGQQVEGGGRCPPLSPGESNSRLGSLGWGKVGALSRLRARKDGLAGGLRVLSEKGTGKLAEGW